MMRAMVVLTLALSSVAAAAADVTGTWTMKVVGGPHGPATMQLILKQDGTTVSGKFVSGHAADMDVAGKFVNGSLEIEADGGNRGKITMTARLKDDGTLAGVLSTESADMKWTASRAADKKSGAAARHPHGEGGR